MTRLDLMGRYLQGTRSFLYKYAFDGQPGNLAELASRSGVGSGGMGGILRAELVAYDDQRPPDCRSIDSASSFAATFRTQLTTASLLAELGVEAPFDIEPTIYALSDRWQRVLAVVDRRLGTPPDVLELEATGTFCLARSEWEPLLAWINQHLAPGDRLSLGALFDRAIDALLESGANDYLPCMALRILQHAVEHAVERMEVWDSDPIETNLWDVARDITPRPGPGASVDEEVAYARLLHYAHRPAEASAILREVLKAKPYHQLAARLEFSRLVGAHDWQGMASLADEVLARPCSLEMRISALRWRCDARFTLHDVVGATADAAELESLGQPWLAKVIRHPDAAWREVDVMNGVGVGVGVGEDEDEDEDEDQDHANGDTLDVVIERLRRVDWSTCTGRRASRVALMKEFLRRSALYSEACALPDRWPFFNIAASVDPGTPEVHLPDGLQAIGLPPRVRDTIRWMLTWAASPPRSHAELPDPYEPLLLFFERGGGFTVENRMVDVDSAGIPLRDRQRYLRGEPFVDLDRAALDALDAQPATTSADGASDDLGGVAGPVSDRLGFPAKIPSA